MKKNKRIVNFKKKKVEIQINPQSFSQVSTKDFKLKEKPLERTSSSSQYKISSFFPFFKRTILGPFGMFIPDPEFPVPDLGSARIN
jgi:hypothetical protein